MNKTNQLDEIFERANREAARWYILLALDRARPSEFSEQMILHCINGICPQFTARELRRELDYLATRGLLTIDKQPHGQWWAKLTRDGIDVVEYTAHCDAGIARPVKE